MMKFKKGDRVIVCNFEDRRPRRRYFSHIDEAGAFHCFAFCGDEWSSRGKTIAWDICEKPEVEK